MRLSKRLNWYLRDSYIDFGENFIVAVLPQDKNHAVILTAPRKVEQYKYFRIQYKDMSLFYGDIESMMRACVGSGYVSRFRANCITKNYYKHKGEN